MKISRNDRQSRIDDFTRWLEGVGGSPKLHVNGPSFSTAVVSVDFGSPLEPVRLSQDVSSEMHSRLRELTTDLTGRRSVRIQFDHLNGVYWASI